MKNWPTRIHASKIEHDLVTEVVLFEEGNYSRPLAILSANEAAALLEEIEDCLGLKGEQE